jgi:hypothetical protein
MTTQRPHRIDLYKLFSQIPSLRSGFTAYFALSPVTGLFCHRRSTM